MKTIASILLLAGALLALPPAGSGSDIPKGKGSLSGKWSGAWGNAYQEGTMSFEILPTGEVKGTLTNASEKIEGTLTGTVDNSGKIPATFNFVYIFSKSKYSGSGPVLLDGKGKLIGITELSRSDKSHLGTIALDLTREPEKP